MRALVLSLFLMLSCSPLVQACVVCFGDPESPQSKGLAVGVLLLMAIIGMVLAAIGVTAFRWSRRGKALEQELHSSV